MPIRMPFLEHGPFSVWKGREIVGKAFPACRPYQIAGCNFQPIDAVIVPGVAIARSHAKNALSIWQVLGIDIDRIVKGPWHTRLEQKRRLFGAIERIHRDLLRAIQPFRPHYKVVAVRGKRRLGCAIKPFAGSLLDVAAIKLHREDALLVIMRGRLRTARLYRSTDTERSGKVPGQLPATAAGF
jgi:hypothetical protein